MAHFALGVIHRHKGDALNVIEQFNSEDEDYFERTVYKTKKDFIVDYRYFYPGTTLSDEEIWSLRSEEHEDYDDNYIYINENPRGQYDYCLVGGRFTCLLKVRKNKGYNIKHIAEGQWDQTKNRYNSVDEALIKDILFDKMNNNKTRIKKLTKKWETTLCVGLLDDYIVIQNTFCPYAFYDEETDEWISIRDFVDEKDYIKEFYNRLNERQEYWLTIVDCHE